MILFNVVSVGDNPLAHIKLLLPPEMKSGEKYPLIVRVYGGPGTSRVKDNFDLGTNITFMIFDFLIGCSSVHSPMTPNAVSICFCPKN